MRPIPTSVIGSARSQCRLAMMSRWVARLGVATICAVLGGCATGGAVDIAELNFKRIPAKEPLIVHVPVEQCFWWRDGDRICVSMRHDQPVWFSQLGRKEFEMSLVLPGIPADQARNYRIGRSAMRCYRHNGAYHARFNSIRGIVGVWKEPHDVLRVRFRLMARKQVFHILTGWSKVGQVMMTGEFRARRDRERGERILLESEKDGMGRPKHRNTPSDGRPRPVQVTGPPVKAP